MVSALQLSHACVGKISCETDASTLYRRQWYCIRRIKRLYLRRPRQLARWEDLVLTEGYLRGVLVFGHLEKSRADSQRRQLSDKWSMSLEVYGVVKSEVRRLSWIFACVSWEHYESIIVELKFHTVRNIAWHCFVLAVV
jgi:hypothetical protein